MEKKNQVLEEIKKELNSSQEVLVKNAIKNIQKKGDHTLIETILEVYQSTDNLETKNELGTMLSSLKISKAEDELLKALNEPKFGSIHQDILSFIWNSGFQPMDHLLDFVSVAIKGDYMTALEALTLVENLDGPFQEELIIESTIELKNYISENQKDEKIDLMKSLLGVVSTFVIE